jgi:hypothetical protein
MCLVVKHKKSDPKTGRILFCYSDKKISLWYSRCRSCIRDTVRGWCALCERGRVISMISKPSKSSLQ